MNVSHSAGGPNRTLAELQADVESTFVLLDMARGGDGGRSIACSPAIWRRCGDSPTAGCPRLPAI
jgi:hypothetical protein